MEIIPFAGIASVLVEHLHPMVFAIGDIDPAVRITADVVHDVEPARSGARLAPRRQQLSIGRELVHARVAVAVRHVDVAFGRQRGVGAAVERQPAHERRRPTRHADLQLEFSLRRETAHGVVAVIGAIDRVVRADVNAVGFLNTPSPHERRKLPSRSNTTTGCLPREKT